MQCCNTLVSLKPQNFFFRLPFPTRLPTILLSLPPTPPNLISSQTHCPFLSFPVHSFDCRCMDALGREAFSDAYRFLKHFEEVSCTYRCVHHIVQHIVTWLYETSVLTWLNYHHHNWFHFVAMFGRLRWKSISVERLKMCTFLFQRLHVMCSPTPSNPISILKHHVYKFRDVNWASNPASSLGFNSIRTTYVR